MECVKERRKSLGMWTEGEIVIYNSRTLKLVVSCCIKNLSMLVLIHSSIHLR